MKRVGDVLSSIFDEGMMQKAKGYSALFSCWQDMTAKNGIAAAGAHSWIQSLERGMVWIEVDHPGWKQILQTKESKLLSDFRYRFPDMDISGLSIMLSRTGRHPESALSDESEILANESDGLTSESGVSNESIPFTNESNRVSFESAVAEAPPAAEGYNAIKDKALKEVLMRLEKSIAAREAASAGTAAG